MIIDRDFLKEFPYRGSFWDGTPRPTYDLINQESEVVVVLSTDCDIQVKSETLSNGNSVRFYKVYFPPYEEQVRKVVPGLYFSGKMGDYIKVKGIVLNVSESQLGGYVAYVRDIEGYDGYN